MEENKSVAYYHIEAMIEHPRRDKLLMTNDLAIIKVRVPFKFSKNVQPISIGNLSVDRLHENETVTRPTVQLCQAPSIKWIESML